MAHHGLSYSHGGTSEGATVAVPGNVTGPGRTIEITQAADCPPLIVKNIGSDDVVFRIEFNATLASTANFEPDPTMWINANMVGNITLHAGEGDAYSLRTQIPFWRTNIISLNPGGEIVSFCNHIFDRTRRWVRAKYPDAQSIQAEF